MVTLEMCQFIRENQDNLEITDLTPQFTHSARADPVASGPVLSVRNPDMDRLLFKGHLLGVGPPGTNEALWLTQSR